MQLVGWADHSFLNLTHSQSRERERADAMSVSEWGGYRISALAIVFCCAPPLTSRVMTWRTRMGLSLGINSQRVRSLTLAALR